MASRPPSVPTSAATGSRTLPALLLLFAGSGCAALIYEIVWFQMLEFAIGASGVSLGVLLGVFMGGMFLGSLTLPRFVPPDRHPLRVYAVLEAGIGVLGLLLLVLIPWLSAVYGSVAHPGPASIVVRAVVCAVLLLPPTVLMGATLPAVSRYVEATPKGVSWMGFFYAGNIVGAVAGSLAAGFWLLRLYDITTTTVVAVLVNLSVAGLALLLARMADAGSVATAPVEGDATPGAGGQAIFSRESPGVYVVMALSGLTALGAEVVWTRLMSLLLGATTYTFSIILAVFLAALGIGSGVGSWLARVLRRPRYALGACQLLVAAAVAWTAYWIDGALPYWPVNPSITDSAWYLFQIDVARAVVALLPGPLLWGASFPLAVAAVARRGQDPGRLVGGVYAANTVGAIAGALGFGLLAIPTLGTRGSQRLMVVLAALSAAVALAPALLTARAPAGGPRPGRVGGAVLALGAVALLAVTVPPVPPVLVAYGRYAPTYFPPDALYVEEGMNSSVAVTELDNGVRNLHIGGKVVASTEPQDMRLQRMLGHVTALLHDDPRTVLVVGFGAGVTAGSFVTYPGIERIVICEIEPLITDRVPAYFADVNHDVINDPRVEIVHDDARHYLFTTDETFDLITADPIHPWMKGAAALYTREYFELSRRHLNPGGVITQWVPLYETTEVVVKSELATFFQVFPRGLVWGNTQEGKGYDLVLSARNGDAAIEVDALAERLRRPDHQAVRRSLSEVGFGSAFDVLSTYGGYAPDLRLWLADAQINRDGNLRLMYLAGLGLNRYESADIWNEILGARRFPDEVFRGSPETIDLLRAYMERPRP